MKTLKRLLVLLVGVSLLVVAGVYLRNKAVGPAGWARDNTLKQLKTNLKHPGTMVIRSAYTVQVADPGKQATAIFLCGVVDAQDDAGAFTGGLRFLSRSVDDNAASTFDTDPVVIEDPDQKIQAGRQHVLSAFEARDWNAHCVDPAHPALAPAGQA